MKVAKVLCLSGLVGIFSFAMAGAEPMIAGESKIKSIGEQSFMEINFYKAEKDGCLISVDLVKLKKPMGHIGKKFKLKIGDSFEKELSFSQESKKYVVEIDCLDGKLVTKINNRIF